MHRIKDNLKEEKTKKLYLTNSCLLIFNTPFLFFSITSFQKPNIKRFSLFINFCLEIFLLVDISHFAFAMKLDVPKLTARVRDLFQKKKPVEAYKPDITNYERDFHKLTFEELSQRLNTSVTTGLDESQAKELLTRNGKNRITQKKKNPIFKIIGYFFSGFCPLIFIAAIVCILAWQPIGSINGSQPQVINLALGIMLIIVIFIQAGFTAFQDWSSNKVMKSIKNMMPTETIVIRNRMETKIHVEELVIGDLVALTYGNKVPADLRLVETHDLKFDKSMVQ